MFLTAVLVRDATACQRLCAAGASECVGGYAGIDTPLRQHRERAAGAGRTAEASGASEATCIDNGI